MPNIVDNQTSYTPHAVVTTSYAYYERDSDEAKENAFIILNMLAQMGWTKTAVSALLGNMTSECNMNFGQQEAPLSIAVGHDGRGCMQWTSTENDAINPLYKIVQTLYGSYDDWSDGVKQVNAIVAEYQQTNWAQGMPDGVNRSIERQWYNSTGGRYGFSLPSTMWYDFAHDTTTPVEDLTKIFMISYLRPNYDPSKNHWVQRVENAKYWLEVLGGVDPFGFGRYFPVFLMRKGGMRFG